MKARKVTGQRTKLPPADYWQFRASLNELSAIELDASKAAAAFRQRVAAAEQQRRELFARLGKAHGFDPMKNYAWDDATCELIEIATEPPSASMTVQDGGEPIH